MSEWNPWHGCHKISPGCANCYVYRRDSKYGLNSRKVYKTTSFDLPMRRNNKWQFYITKEDGIVNTCFTSDFLLKDADNWRNDAWKMIKQRKDLTFFFITKRIERFYECIPKDWENGYDNVKIGCTVENQEYADRRLPVFINAPIKHKLIICSPLLSEINLSQYLSPKIEELTVGGESGNEARPCCYNWVLSLYNQAKEKNVRFTFYQTGALFVKDNKEYRIKRRFQHSQAMRSNLFFDPEK